MATATTNRRSDYVETDDPMAFFRALRLGLALALFGWGILAALAYGIYLLFP